MSDDDMLVDCVQKADQWRLEGRPIVVEELCPDRPDLWPMLRVLTDRVNQVDQLLGVASDQAGSFMHGPAGQTHW